MTPRLFTSSILSNIFIIFANSLPTLIPFFRKTSAIAVATLFGSASGVFKETIGPCSADLEMSSTAVHVNGNLVPMLGSQTSMLFIQDTEIILDPSGENVTEAMEKSWT